jgi:hypothetical protein
MCGRLQAPVSRHSCGHRIACCVDKCLRDATRSTGSCVRYMLPTSSAPFGSGSSAQERLWRCLMLSSAMDGSIKDTSLALLVVDAADAEGRMALPPVPKI